MSFAARNSFRNIACATRGRRNSTWVVDSGAPYEKYIAEDKALAHHAADASDLWRKISYYVALPSILVCSAWVYNAEVEHAAHNAHIKEENGGEMPETPGYDFLNRRAKPFPWGPNSVFFNPHTNKDMSDA